MFVEHTIVSALTLARLLSEETKQTHEEDQIGSALDRFVDGTEQVLERWRCGLRIVVQADNCFYSQHAHVCCGASLVGWLVGWLID